MNYKISSVISDVVSLNYNVKLNLTYILLGSIGRGIWLGNILSLFIVALVEESHTLFGLKPNEILGIGSALMGFATTIVVFPAGMIVDKIGKERVIRIAASVGIIAVFFMIFSLSIYGICIGLVLWGLFEGLSKPAVDSLFADSIASGSRSGIYCSAHAVEQFGMALGPFLNILLFVVLSDTWNINTLRYVMICGTILSFCSILVLFFFRDGKSIGSASEAIHLHKTRRVKTQSQHGRPAEHVRFVPIVLLIASIIIGCGAGMTIKYFPIYYKMIYHLKPSGVQLILGITAIFTGVISIVVQRFSLKTGRIEAIITVQIIATACLFLFVFYPPLLIMVLLFMIRGSFMNAAVPLTNSILMDFVPKKERGKWNSINTVAWGLFWNISAIFGGFLIGTDNFRRAFLFTALVYCVGIAPLFLLIRRVHHENHPLPQEGQEVLCQAEELQ
ncbi:MAG: MFS transporter [Chitinivibrionales bacterium]|nr:MFS transporter [Chitinivibrionales bacterium]